MKITWCCPKTSTSEDQYLTLSACLQHEGKFFCLHEYVADVH